MAVSNSIGTFLCIVCLSYSIPFIPLAFLRSESTEAQLKHLQYEISMSKNLLNSLKNEFYNVVEKLAALENLPGLSSADQRHIEEVKKKVPAKYLHLASSNLKCGNIIVENAQVTFCNNL